jgi:molybdenum cofactor cytidylyltransferase
MAGVPVDADDIAGMGVGGLLMEIPTRPQPRELAAPARRTKVHAVLLAAGRSSRMGGPNKLLAGFGGKPLVRLVTERLLASRADGLVVVTGHQADRVREALKGQNARFADNPDFASGLAGSLKTGIRALPAEAEAAMVVLGDMPGLTSADFDALITAFARHLVETSGMEVIDVELGEGASIDVDTPDALALAGGVAAG